jgi:UTP--glucose-1-phosphate uridylyltransferase
MTRKDLWTDRGYAPRMKAVIPAAGLGTRFLPYTKAQPKEMIPLVDKPAIQFVVEEAVASGMREILIVTGRGKRAIEDHFDANVELENHLVKSGRETALEDLKALMAAARIMYVRQPIPRGLGDAILRAADFVEDESFGVLLGDDITVDPPCAGLLRATHERLGGSAIALQQVTRDQIGRYGMAVGKEIEPGLVRLEDMIEKPSPNEIRSTLATIGRYVLTPEIFARLRATEAGKGGEIQLTDGIRSLMKKEDVYGVLYRGRRYDVGDKLGWLTANVELAMERADLREGLKRFLDSMRKGS